VLSECWPEAYSSKIFFSTGARCGSTSMLRVAELFLYPNPHNSVGACGPFEVREAGDGVEALLKAEESLFVA
jgi:hypothetical protein